MIPRDFDEASDYTSTIAAIESSLPSDEFISLEDFRDVARDILKCSHWLTLTFLLVVWFEWSLYLYCTRQAREKGMSGEKCVYIDEL